ncbi:DUF6491 family protein [Sphingosinicella rhizophila]|uniref:DUF6491 family protein n=1 Tax=Sphingosinicella rhizophila TaxID=3050082 RepID=A0ABU3Q8T9_9SPHN|nr:DUF6491 family protein [Sphingosinicella sp. GR2756]MDT9599825.1 DUF6491 family protein [Sphingosinicella sp. GR2756]
MVYSSTRILMSVMLGAASFGLAACAATDEPGRSAAQTRGDSCFRAADVNGFNAVDDDTVNVSVGASQTYQLELFGNCSDIDWAQRIGIRATGGSSWVCQGLDAELIVPSPIGPRQCQISSLRRLSDEEVRASRAR